MAMRARGNLLTLFVLMSVCVYLLLNREMTHLMREKKLMQQIQTASNSAIGSLAAQIDNAMANNGSLRAISGDSGPCAPYQRVMSVSASGRIGNVMSQYATLLAFSSLTNYPAVVQEHMKHWLGLIFTNISLPVIEAKNVTACLKEHMFTVEHNFNFMYETYLEFVVQGRPHTENFVYLKGSPMVIPFYQIKRDIIMKEFVFKDRYATAANDFLASALKDHALSLNNTSIVGVHVRRTDYKGFIGAHYKGSLVDECFFHKAMQSISGRIRSKETNVKNILYVIASDDPVWCKEHLSNFSDVPHVSFTDDFATPLIGRVERHVLDLAVLGHANHSIYDYGTYGFWGGYLANGITILATGYSYEMNTMERLIKQSDLPEYYFIDAAKYGCHKDIDELLAQDQKDDEEKGDDKQSDDKKKDDKKVVDEKKG